MATKTEIIAGLTELIKSEVSPETLEAAIAFIRGTSTAKASREVEIERDGSTYRWCNRHGRYEPIDWFMVEKSGKVKPECAAAYYRWVDIGTKINQAVKAEEFERIGSLTVARKSAYNFEDDIIDFKEKVEKELGFLPEDSEALLA